MDVNRWITRFRKSLRSKKSPLKSPRVAQVAAVSLVAVMSLGAAAFAAYLASPSIDAAPVVKAVPAKATATSPAPAKKASALKARPANAVAVAEPSDTVTITGCLEQDHDTFKLKDTSGDAPKSRSWKSGFLRKHSSAVTIVDGANNRLQLGTHVGERVSVTGALADRERRDVRCRR